MYFNNIESFVSTLLTHDANHLLKANKLVSNFSLILKTAVQHFEKIKMTMLYCHIWPMILSKVSYNWYKVQLVLKFNSQISQNLKSKALTTEVLRNKSDHLLVLLSHTPCFLLVKTPPQNLNRLNKRHICR